MSAWITKLRGVVMRAVAARIPGALVRWGGLVLGGALVAGSWRAEPSLTWVTVVVICLAAAATEMLPLHLRSGVRSGRVSVFTFSSVFYLALVVVAPLWAVLAARFVPSLLDDIRRRRSLGIMLLNLGLTTACIAASRGVFALVAGQPLLQPQPFGRADLAALVAAGVAYFAVEHLVIGVVTAAQTRAPLAEVLGQDLAPVLLGNLVELSLTPLTLVAASFHPLFVGLLLVPLLPVRRSIKLAALREQEALRDRLTGLPNRTYVSGHIDEQAEGGATAVLLIDLDHFREINNILGHQVGDVLVRDVGARLAGVLREGDAVARFGGDEFAIVAGVEADTARKEATDLADRLVRALLEPFTIEGVRIDVQASIGIALAPDHGRTAEELLARADAALSIATEARSGWSFFEALAEQPSPEKLSLLGQLRDGIERDELEVHYQPKVSAASRRIEGVEALVRWRHPERGLLGPYEFVPLAENTGLIQPLTMAVLDQAVAQLRRWLDGGRELGVSVNISARHVVDPRLPDQITEVLQRHGVPPRLLTVEVTESSLMTDASQAAVVLHAVRALGVHVSVDDFGTGYSSLSHLQKMEVDEVKIDRSFVMNLPRSAQDEVIVRAVIDLGHNLGLKVVAEGVEDAETGDRLRAFSCDELQGYLLSRPLPAPEITAWFTAWEDQNEVVPA